MEDSGEENIVSGPEFQVPLPPVTIGQIFFKKLMTQPPDHHVQVEAESGRVVTSSEFLKLSMMAAEGLRAMGAEVDDVICVVGKNGVDLSIAVVGGLFLGATIAPVDPGMKNFEFQHVFRVMEPKFVFCDADVAAEVSTSLSQIGNESPIILLEAGPEEPSHTRFEDFLVETSDFQPTGVEDTGASLAFIVCSSGTTGLPKGVQLTHRNFIYQMLLYEMISSGALSPDLSSAFMQTSHFFWISGLVMFCSSLAGGLTRITVRNPSEDNILKAIQEHKEKGPPGVQCSQAYGLSEVSGAATTTTPGDDLLSVGRPMPGVQFKFLDLETGRALGPNEEGHMLMKSLGLMKGYRNNEEETQNAIDEDGWLHTGDIGYYDETNLIYLSGRIKEFIKYMNMQIAPAEIEQLIFTVSGVADVGVAGVSVDADTYYPMALVVRESDAEITEEDIVKVVNVNLSDYKHLRGGVVFVDDIPRTPTGKIRRRDLQSLAKTLYMDDPIS